MCSPFHCLSLFIEVFDLLPAFVRIQIFQFLPQLYFLLFLCRPQSSLFFRPFKKRERSNHRKVAFKGSDWAQLYTTVSWFLLPISICKSLRILFVCLFEPGQVCWVWAKITVSNHKSHFLWYILLSFALMYFLSLELTNQFAQSANTMGLMPRCIKYWICVWICYLRVQNHETKMQCDFLSQKLQVKSNEGEDMLSSN